MIREMPRRTVLKAMPDKNVMNDRMHSFDTTALKTRIIELIARYNEIDKKYFYHLLKALYVSDNTKEFNEILKLLELEDANIKIRGAQLRVQLNQLGLCVRLPEEKTDTPQQPLEKQREKVKEKVVDTAGATPVYEQSKISEKVLRLTHGLPDAMRNMIRDGMATIYKADTAKCEELAGEPKTIMLITNKEEHRLELENFKQKLVLLVPRLMDVTVIL